MQQLLTTTAYFAPYAWFKAAGTQAPWVWEGQENYQKGGWRNRCRIMTANGPLLLSVPLEGGKHQQMPIREVRISYRTDWWRQHEQTIRSAYGRSPFYEFYAEELFAVARQRPPTLWELNWELTKVILQFGDWQNELSISENFGGVKYTETSVTDAYPQVFGERFPFQNNLSVLDALFCLGPEA